MKHSYDAIYLAPHLDDVVLSCGGQIYLQTQAGQNVLVVTIMAGDPPQRAMTSFAQQLHENWQLGGSVADARRAEDAAACAVLGAEYQHWDFLDCIYRLDAQTGTGHYESNEALFGTVHEADAQLVEALAERLRGLPRCGRLLAPLTVGNHVDHQIVHRAAATLPQERVAYYEDFPYAAVPGAREKALGADPDAWREEVIPLTPEALQAKIDAIAAYKSQISTLFSTLKNLNETTHAFTAMTGGERLWWRADSS